ncbi:SDR family oxidoreductase [Arthrobacter sp. CJ23]|uniref:SDR family oxidoreductase n=1 Tax=Arthrobacter sp. CJ23 TaxID=2972479 RepID=UPI00215B859D|nr:SDR family oxidoreductase [Arthrobacter sp. CJ23]UVJ38474.1 SDR family oxidoreductase [Arthrobacter sp. CJ23]
MTSICVAGGTGQVGREVVRLALAAGHRVAVISRHEPLPGSPARHDGASYFTADITTGKGLPGALAGADVVIDCLEGQFGKARKTFADGGARLLAAAQLAGARKAVALSIINCDQSSYAFYASKADKERRYAESGLETVVVRATQFHSLVAAMFEAGAKVRLLPAFKGVQFQTISPSEVAGALLEAALEAPSDERHRLRTVGGPDVQAMRELAEAWKSATGARGRIVELPLPGAMGAYLRAGKNLVPEQRYGSESFVSWLAKQRDSL